MNFPLEKMMTFENLIKPTSGNVFRSIGSPRKDTSMVTSGASFCITGRIGVEWALCRVSMRVSCYLSSSKHPTADTLA